MAYGCQYRVICCQCQYIIPGASSVGLLKVTFGFVSDAFVRNCLLGSESRDEYSTSLIDDASVK
jgi:hypothetical protein